MYEMVISFMTVYVIAFSCFTLLVDKSLAVTPVSSDVSSRQTYKEVQKIGLRGKDSKNADDVKSRRPSEETVRTSMATSHAYLAAFDPVTNVTKRVGSFDQRAKKRHPWSNEKIRDFVVWDVLKDSEKEIRVHINGITAKETLVTTGIDEETGKRQGLKLRQLTDGNRFIQLIYTLDGEIQDCEYLKQKKAVHKFLDTFARDVEEAKKSYEKSIKNYEEINLELPEDYLEDEEGGIESFSSWHGNEPGENDVKNDVRKDFGSGYRNVTFQIVRKREDLPTELTEWMNYPALREKCRENHRILKSLARDRRYGDDQLKKIAEQHIERVKRSMSFLIYPGTKWCGKSSSADRYTDLGGYFKADKCCRAHDHCHPLIKAFQSDFGHFNFRPFTISHCHCDSRRKRDIMDVLLVPGTKWCGKGRRATKYTSLGGFTRTDKCCRVHDTMCPHWIGSMQEKYGLFNWRINTIMHCRCDKRFRACLKMAKTGTANFVGKLFFNVVQTKCFVLKPKEVCLKYSWWGKCEKKEYRKQAYLKDNLSY